MDFQGDRPFSFSGECKFRGNIYSLFLEPQTVVLKEAYNTGISLPEGAWLGARPPKVLATFGASCPGGEWWVVGNARPGQVTKLVGGLVSTHRKKKKIVKLDPFFRDRGEHRKIFDWNHHLEKVANRKVLYKPSVFSFHVSFSGMATCPDMWL